MKSVIIIAIIVIIGTSAFMLSNNIINFNQENLQNTIQQIPENLKGIIETAKDSSVLVSEKMTNEIADVSNLVDKTDVFKINSKVPDLDPQARILELQKLMKDCSIYDFKKLDTMAVLKLPDKEMREYYNTEISMTTAKRECMMYNGQIAGSIKTQESLIEQKWLNTP